jgi:hypothetical protein
VGTVVDRSAVRTALLGAIAVLTALPALLFIAFQSEIPRMPGDGPTQAAWAVLFALTAVAAVAAIRRPPRGVPRLASTMAALSGVLVVCFGLGIDWPLDLSLPRIGPASIETPTLWRRLSTPADLRWVGIIYVVLAVGVVASSWRSRVERPESG